jgi:hypothetical protein
MTIEILSHEISHSDSNDLENGTSAKIHIEKPLSCAITSYSCPSLSFRVENMSLRARQAKLRLPHGVLETPIFMPVGTHGTVKGMTNEDVRSILDSEIFKLLKIVFCFFV